MGAAVIGASPAQNGEPVTRISASAGHRLWAPHYDEDPNPLLALENRLLRPVLAGCAPKRVVDVACGTGRWMRYFAQLQISVFGVDVCLEMLQEAKRHAGLRTRLVRGDVLQLPFAAASANLILCSFALGYIADLKSMFAELARIAAAGAAVVVTDLHPDALAAGWTRSFKLDGRSYYIEHSIHSEPAILDTASSAGLALESKRHACFGEPEFPLFERAGKASSFEELSRVPAIWTAIWKKPC